MEPDPTLPCGGLRARKLPLERSVLTRGKASLVTYIAAGSAHPTLVLCEVEKLRQSDLEPLEKLQAFCTRRHVLFAVVAPGEAARPMAETLQRWGIMVFLQPPSDDEIGAFIRLQRVLRNPAVWPGLG